MSAFGFATAGQIRFGRGTAAEAPGLITGLGRRVLLVHGRDPARATWLREALTAAGADQIAIACPQEPDLPLLEAGIATARAFAPDVVVALGGGAAIDLGKALAALIPAPGVPMDHLEVVGRALPLTAAPLPFVALPTTSGTGAEVTRNAVIGVPEHARKVSLRDPRMLPRIAIVDPALTDGLPWAVTLASGLDALTQVIEPYLSSRANPLTDALTRAAIPLALPALIRLRAGEDAGARDAMALVSLNGGLALANAGLGAVHGFAGVLGGRGAGAHGAICGALLPGVLLALRRAARPGSPLSLRLDEVANWLAEPLGAAPDNAFEALARWSLAAGLPRLGAMGLQAENIGTIAAETVLSSSMKASAIAFSEADLAAILRAAL